MRKPITTNAEKQKLGRLERFVGVRLHTEHVRVALLASMETEKPGNLSAGVRLLLARGAETLTTAKA